MGENADRSVELAGSVERVSSMEGGEGGHKRWYKQATTMAKLVSQSGYREYRCNV